MNALVKAHRVFNRFLKPEVRYARRMARIARWDRPLTGTFDRLWAWTHMIFADHGLFRLVYLNAHQVFPQLWRSAQPSPRDITRFARLGVKTIVTLRGGREHGGWPLEKEACLRHGLALEEVTVRSRGAPSRDGVLAICDAFARIRYPALMHCKSGADRAGFCAGIAVLAKGGTAAQAMDQLHWRYGHFRFAKTGILDAFLSSYQREGEAKGLSFFDWVEKVYDPDALERSFKPGFWSTLVADRVLKRE